MTRRISDIYSQLASDRDHQAGLCVAYVLEGEWDRASAAAKTFEELQRRCHTLVMGSWAVEDQDLPT